MNRKVVWGILGTAKIAREKVIPGMRKSECIEIRAIASRDEQRARSTAAALGVPVAYGSYEALLADPEIEAIYNPLPNHLHVPMTLQAAAAGKHVLCEKPIAMKMEDAVRMTEACAAADVRFGLGFVRQFSTEWLKMREIITSRRIGRPVIWRHACAIRVPFLRWFVDREKGGGPFIDGLVHDYDFALSTFGDAEWAMGSLMTFSEHSTALDTGSAIVHFKSGDEIVRSWSWGLPGPSCNSAAWQDVIGPGGAIRFPKGDEGANLFVINGDGSEEAFPYEPAGGQEWFDRQIAHFVDCVKEGKEPLATGAHGIRALEIALAVLEAGETHQLVKI